MCVHECVCGGGNGEKLSGVEVEFNFRPRSRAAKLFSDLLSVCRHSTGECGAAITENDLMNLRAPSSGPTTGRAPRKRPSFRQRLTCARRLLLGGPLSLAKNWTLRSLILA